MIKELRDIVGAKNVLDNEEALALYAQDRSLSAPKKPFAVAKVNSAEQIQELIAFANKTFTPLIPSSSTIHFYGATLPEHGGVVVDLSGMNKILEIDPLNRKVKIEPGVTWHQLQQALKEHDQMPLNPLFPHPGTSAMTSSLEREPMLIPKYEYGDPVLTMQVHLGNGQLFRTGTASDKHTYGAYPEGPGIDFWRFFLGAQGTMGIVSWLNIKTEYRPKYQKAYFVACDELEDAADPIYKLQRRHIGNECFVLNRFLLAQLLCKEYPKDFTKLMDDLPPYTIILVIAGAPRRPLERIAYEEEALMEIATDMKFEAAKTVGGVAGLGTAILDMLHDLPADGPYWKTRYKNSTQDIFFITTMDRAQGYVEIAQGYAAAYGLTLNELGVYMQPLERGRACHLCFSLPCDLDSEQDRQRIATLHTELSQTLFEQGAFFSRPYGTWADMVYRHATTYTATLKELKKIFDPNNILNPGKLCF
ncbi:MAG: FAD-binding oxidoreductase [Desulfobacterota bacterium]|nr:FAD-binding oxidoreductase [Thermodesulfobacteriota bacterium]